MIKVWLVLGLALTAGLVPVATLARCPWVWGAALEGHPITPDILARQVNESGLKPGIVLFFLSWPAPGAKGGFPLASLKNIHQARAAACLTWEPMYHDAKGTETAVLHEHILSGAYDPYLTDFARAARQWGRPFIIRFAHEMNLLRYHWGTGRQAYGPASPGVYKKMYRYVVDLFRREGANNVLWAFCPNAESQPHPQWDGAKWNRASAYYPGDAYVDLMGMDGYNWGTSQTKKLHGWDSRWLSFSEIFTPLYQELKNLGRQKPILVFETASAAQGGSRSRWVQEAANCVRDWRMPALIWFQVKKEVDWRLLRGRDQKAIQSLRPGTACAAGWLERLSKNQPMERR